MRFALGFALGFTPGIVYTVINEIKQRRLDRQAWNQIRALMDDKEPTR